MLNVRRSAIAALAVLASVGACRQPSAQENKPAATAPQSKAAPTPPEPPKPVPAQLPPVIARVNGEDITRTEFDDVIAQLEKQNRGPVPKERRDEIFRGVIDQLVTDRLIAQEIKTRGIKPDEKEIDAKMQELRARFKTEEEFKMALAQNGVTPEQVRADVIKQTGVGTIMKAEAEKVPPVTDPDVKAFYDQNPDKFKQEAGVRASHILIPVEKGATPAAKKTARGKAASILKQVKSGGDFAKLAQEHSSDGSAEKGGDLGFFGRGRMVAPFDQAAFALKPGEVSDLVETEYGFHIIKLTGQRGEGLMPLEEVADKVREFLTRQRREQRAEAFIKELKSKAKIEVLV